MANRPRTYRKKPLAMFEDGTRISAPSRGEPRYRVVATDADGDRVYHKFAREEDARAKARRSRRSSWAAPRCARLISRGPSLPLRRPTSSTWLAAPSATANDRARSSAPGYGPSSATFPSDAGRRRTLNGSSTPHGAHGPQPPCRNIGSCLRSLVTFADKSRWLPRDVDPMWQSPTPARTPRPGRRVHPPRHPSQRRAVPSPL